MAPLYKILATQPWTYLGDLNQMVAGFRVSFEIVEFQEKHVVEVPSLNEGVVKAAIEKVVTDRKRLSQVGVA